MDAPVVTPLFASCTLVLKSTVDPRCDSVCEGAKRNQRAPVGCSHGQLASPLSTFSPTTTSAVNTAKKSTTTSRKSQENRGRAKTKRVLGSEARSRAGVFSTGSGFLTGSPFTSRSAATGGRGLGGSMRSRVGTAARRLTPTGEIGRNRLPALRLAANSTPSASPWPSWCARFREGGLP